MNRARLFALVFALAAVVVAILVYAQRQKSTAGGGGTGKGGSSVYTGGHPASSKCISSCSLTSREGVLKAFEDATGTKVPENKDCAYINSKFPRVVPFGTFNDAGKCVRAGTLYGCCFTADPRPATADALELTGWSTASLAKRTEMPTNCIRFGIYGLTSTIALADRQDFFEARLILKRTLDEPQGLPLPDGGLKLRMWLVVHETQPGGDLVKDDYTRWEYIFAPDGALTSEKMIDRIQGPPH